MRSVRREEGYADLVGLAWAQQRHRQKYERLHTWLLAERSRDLIPGSHHDTLAWIQMARDGNTLIPHVDLRGSCRPVGSRTRLR